ncbi:MAG: hypothetical protein NT069_11900, partial [Planctomycetota bacterium]|nr:hypothetical protein [Planctomycetota bacterium]
MHRIRTLMVLALFAAAPASGGEIGFVEDFVLAGDRAKALEQLVPGTEDFYYFHSLHYLATEQYAKVVELQAPWLERHGESQRLWEIRTRHALLTYDRAPQASLDYLIRRTGVQFNHQREDLSAEPNLPTKLDPELISRAQFQQRAVGISTDNVNGFENDAIDWLIQTPLHPNQRRDLLGRLTRPDYPKLVDLIVADLNHENSGGFGSLGIHTQLLLTQLEELAKKKPELLNHQAFVNAYLKRLQPSADEDWRHDPKLLEAYLIRLSQFAKRLGPVHNSLKAHVLYHQLVLDQQQGKLNRERFLAYLQLPRPVGYAAESFLKSESIRRFPCDLNRRFIDETLFPVIGDDEPLVRSHLLHFLKELPNAKEFEPFVNDVYLKYLLAEAKIVNGLGTPEQWAALLPPEIYQRLKERIDIDFAPTNPTQFAVDQPVVLDVAIKNVPPLIVKVFEVNT